MRKVPDFSRRCRFGSRCRGPGLGPVFPCHRRAMPYGYNNNYGQVRRLQVRINQIQRQIDRWTAVTS